MMTRTTGLSTTSKPQSAGILERLEYTLDGTGIRWTFRTVSGDPARARGQFAESADASVIVVGTRELGLGTRLEQLLVGSVAVGLTHRQHRPVLVVPLPRQTIPGNVTD
uniref:universal stress protein n=1 Tax=Arthrobacter sp. 68b TaxID=311808 RepID=UPI0020B35627|nr:universal stress protein [Arthrobacter sp. 68b]